MNTAGSKLKTMCLLFSLDPDKMNQITGVKMPLKMYLVISSSFMFDKKHLRLFFTDLLLVHTFVFSSFLP